MNQLNRCRNIIVHPANELLSIGLTHLPKPAPPSPSDDVSTVCVHTPLCWPLSHRNYAIYQQAPATFADRLAVDI